MITKKGVLVAILGPLLVAAGVATGRGGLTGLGVALVAYLAVGNLFAPRRVLEGSLTLSQDRLREDDAFVVSATLSTRRERTGLVEAHVALPGVTKVTQGEPLDLTVIRPAATHELRFTANVPARGVYPIGPVEVRARDPFGLFSLEWELAPSTSLTVYPRWRLVKDLPLRGKTPRMLAGKYVVHQPGDSLEFFGLREYIPGDALRSVNWKATAKEGELIVNQWERESVTEATIFVDARLIAGIGTQLENPLLHEARIAATLVAYFLGSRDTARLVVYGDSVHSHRGGRGEGHFHNILQDLAQTTPSGATPLGHAVGIMLPHIKPKSPVVVLSTCIGDDTVGSALARLMAQGNKVLLLAPIPRVDEKSAGGKAVLDAFKKGVEGARDNGAPAFEVNDQDHALDIIGEVVLA